MATIPGKLVLLMTFDLSFLMVEVVVKHQGKKYDVEVDPSSNGETFKFQVYSLTGVQPERQKILVKGGQLKDDTDMSKIGLKAGAMLMMMGAPEDGFKAIERPKEKIRFLEDMTEAEQAQTEGATPAGLQNLGNTCYMNSTLQVLKSIPELQGELQKYSARWVGADAMHTKLRIADLTKVQLAVNHLHKASLALPGYTVALILQLACAICSSKWQKPKKDSRRFYFSKLCARYFHNLRSVLAMDTDSHNKTQKRPSHKFCHRSDRS